MARKQELQELHTQREEVDRRLGENRKDGENLERLCDAQLTEKQALEQRYHLIVSRIRKLDSEQKWDEGQALQDQAYQLRDESRDKLLLARDRKAEAIQALNESMVASAMANL